ncbi:MAG: hypothetical protein J7K45_04660 [Thaumarchaeota archaeon]|nr:hypothetical protein [Nitrososphaerota archaeon]
MKKEDGLYWTRIGLAVVAAFLALGLGFNSNNPSSYLALIIPAVLYMASLYVGRRLGVEGRKLYTVGAGSFVLMFFFVWTLVNTLVFL